MRTVVRWKRVPVAVRVAITVAGCAAPALAFAGEAPLSAQEISGYRVTLTESPCDGCLEARKILTIGDLSGPDGLGSTFAMTRQPDTGHFLYSSNTSRGEILRFNERGVLLDVFGGQGQGPEEFRWITELHAGPSRLDAIDVANIRWTTLYDDGRSTTTRRLPRPVFSSAIVGDSLLVASINIRTRSLVGLPFHIIAPSGEILRSFGEDPNGYRSDILSTVNRQVAPSGRSHFWAASPSNYRLQQWDLAGNVIKELVRSATWFTAHHDGMVADPAIPPKPWLVDLQEIAGGLVAVMILVADEAWYEGVVPRAGGSGYTWSADRRTFLDTVIEVVDPDAGTVAATERWDFAAAGFVDEEHFGVYRESDAGVPTIEVWRLSLSRRDATPPQPTGGTQ